LYFECFSWVYSPSAAAFWVRWSTVTDYRGVFHFRDATAKLGNVAAREKHLKVFEVPLFPTAVHCNRDHDRFETADKYRFVNGNLNIPLWQRIFGT
jgi:hypothetical protein